MMLFKRIYEFINSIIFYVLNIFCTRTKMDYLEYDIASSNFQSFKKNMQKYGKSISPSELQSLTQFASECRQYEFVYHLSSLFGTSIENTSPKCKEYIAITNSSHVKIANKIYFWWLKKCYNVSRLSGIRIMDDLLGEYQNMCVLEQKQTQPQISSWTRREHFSFGKETHLLFFALMLGFQRLEEKQIIRLAHQAMFEDMLEFWDGFDSIDLITKKIV